MLRAAASALTLVGSAVFAGGVAGAQDFEGAQAPSHNIFC
jgi:hypothetical protein